MSDSEEQKSGSGSDLQEEEYVVEKVVGKKTVKGKVHYLLKWKGYPNSDNTWEPVANVDCPDLIAEYEDFLKKQKGESSKGGRSKQADKASTSSDSQTISRQKTTSKRKRVVQLASSDEDDDEIESLSKLSDKSDDIPKITKKPQKKSKRNASEDEIDYEPVKDKDSDISDLDYDDSDEPQSKKSTTSHRKASPPRDSPSPKPNRRSTNRTANRRASSSDSEAEIVDLLASDQKNKDKSKANEKLAEPQDEVPDVSLEPEKIIGATESNGELMFLIKWKNTNKADLLSSKVAKVACPLTVIEFFEKQVCWQDKPSSRPEVDV